MEQKFDFPTEIIELPSKGLVYDENNPLSSGKIEMKYMTAKEEDILTNQSYIEKGIVLDKLMQSLIVSKIDYNDLILGDKNAIMVAARVLGYGKDYKFTYNKQEYNIDLSKIENKKIDETLFTKGNNNFLFTLPASGANITFKILTHGDEKKIDQELAGIKKINPDASPELSTRLKYTITSVSGKTEQKEIREFIDKYLLARDSKALRDYIKSMQPDVDLIFFPDGSAKSTTIPIGLDFFWPDINS